MKVCVVGGGAAGMMAASLIAKKGHNVLLFEKNEKLGKKIYITGTGRCNVTNAARGYDFLKNIVVGQKFMMSAMSRFDSQDTINFFDEMQIPLKKERGNRIFPVSDKASDIIKGLERAMLRSKVNILLNSKIDKILTKENKVYSVFSNGKEYTCDVLIIATGGISYPSTGSSGDGYKFAKELGHSVVEPVPALCAIKIKNNEFIEIEGLSLKNVKLTAKIGQKTHFESEIGEMIFTNDGISGPLVLTASSYVNRLKFDDLKLYIDFKPALSYDEILARIDKDISSLKAKQISTLLEGFLPKSLVHIFAKRLGVDSKFKANQLNKDLRKKLASLLKNFELVPLSLEDFNQAVVTSGGVNLKEINPKNMQSKILSNL